MHHGMTARARITGTLTATQKCPVHAGAAAKGSPEFAMRQVARIAAGFCLGMQDS